MNLECNLTVDDLIIEYMAEKLKQGYEPSVSLVEINDFINFFNNQKIADELTYDKNNLFINFLKRKEEVWSIDTNDGEKIYSPHLVMDENGLIVPNNDFSDCDLRVINLHLTNYFERKYVNEIITKYLLNLPKRNINTQIKLSKEIVEISQYVTALIVNVIWNDYVNNYIKLGKWPNQCKDINEFLLEMDLAEIIKMPSIREKLLNFYAVVSKRIACLIQKDLKIELSSESNKLLAYSNYLVAMNGFEKLLNCKHNRISVDFYNKKFSESHELERICSWGDEPDYITTTNNFEDRNIKNLSLKLNQYKM